MKIGNSYADNKIYSNIIHYDSLPLTSRDIHEQSDTQQMKHKFLLNNLLGSGVLNEPELSYNQTGISLSSPLVALLDGDISLIQTEGDILKVSDINNSGITDGVLCIVGWYQYLNVYSTLRAYGGVNNPVLDNDIMDPDLKIQVSTRCQFRWDTVLLSKRLLDIEGNIAFDLLRRDESGELIGGTGTVSTYTKTGSIRTAKPLSNMDYAVSDLYVIPILKYNYENNRFSGVKVVDPLRTNGVGEIVKSITEPIEDLEEGIIWYNSDTRRFFIYIEGIGFIPTAPSLYLHEYNNVVTINLAFGSNLEIAIGLSLIENDILKVHYNGVLLNKDIHYEVLSNNTHIRLIDFEVEVGDQITITVNRLGEGADAGIEISDSLIIF